MMEQLKRMSHAGRQPVAGGEGGAAGLAGMLIIFAASALVITLVMLFVTGVAQRGILPRLKGKADRAVPEAIAAGDAVTSPLDADALGGDGSPSTLDSLRALREQIRVERVTLEDQIQELDGTRQRLQDERELAEEAATVRIASLAKVYSRMKPEVAARVMVYLDDETFAQVFAKLNQRQAAKIVAYLDPGRIARLTQKAASAES